MQRLAAKHTLNQTLRALGYQGVRLSSREETRAMASEVFAQRDQLEQLERELRRAREARVGATGEVALLDKQLDKLVARFVRQLRGEVEGPNDPRLIVLFKEQPNAAMVEVASEKQARFVQHLADTIRAREDLAPYAATADALEGAQRELDAALARREALYRAEHGAASQLRLALHEAQEGYNVRYARLLFLFPKDADLVDSFFATLTRAAGPGDDEDEAGDDELGPVV
jgi:hypothetical protein